MRSKGLRRSWMLSPAKYSTTYGFTSSHHVKSTHVRHAKRQLYQPPLSRWLGAMMFMALYEALRQAGA